MKQSISVEGESVGDRLLLLGFVRTVRLLSFPYYHLNPCVETLGELSQLS